MRKNDFCEFCYLNDSPNCHLQPECPKQVCENCGMPGHGREICPEPDELPPVECEEGTESEDSEGGLGERPRSFLEHCKYKTLYFDTENYNID